MSRLNVRATLFAVLACATAAAILLASGCELSLGQDAREASIGLDAAIPALSAEIEEVEEEEAPVISLDLRLPTSNDALLRDDGAAFYQDLERTFPGIRPYAWMGGQYGIVRTPVNTPAGQTFTRVHQGVDIRPVYRDRNGEPLDTVRAIDAGTVVYVNRAANGSSYGRYVVIRHDWAGSPIYSLSAHLNSLAVNVGDEVDAGDPIGGMGYTGRGINRERAHLHLEVALLLNSDYNRWHGAFYRGANPHGLYNGLNMRGIDVSGLYVALRDEPSLTFLEFIHRKPVAYSIALPGDRPLDILDRYAWLGTDGITNADAGPGSWVLSFTREGVPVRITRQDSLVTAPTVTYIAPEIRQRYLSTAGVLTRSGDNYTLTRAGQGYMALLATSSAGVPRWF